MSHDQDTEYLLKLNAEKSAGAGSAEISPKQGKAVSAPIKAFKDEVPDVDPERVARAKALLANETYPCSKVLKSVAQHLASNWVDNSGSGSGSRDVTPRQG